MKTPKLSRQLFVRMGVMLFGFSIVVFGLFGIILRVSLIQVYQHQTNLRAQQIASALNNVTSHRQIMGGAPMYLRFLYDSTNEKVYLIDSDYQLETHQDNEVSEFSQLDTSIQKYVVDIFNLESPKQSIFSNLFSNLYYSATPVINNRGVITGVVLVQIPENTFDFVAVAIYIAIAGSLMLGLVAVVFFANKQSKLIVEPIDGLIQYVKKIINDVEINDEKLANNQEMQELEENLLILSYKLQQAKQQRKQIEKQQKQFIASVSHELKTPITIIQGYLEALEDNVINQEDMIDTISYMNKQVGILKVLIDDLLEITRLDNPEFSLSKITINLSDVINQVVQDNTQKATKKSITIRTAINDETIVNVDEKRITQLFTILIDNAIKFSDENSLIEIVQQQDSQHIFYVKDQGIGLVDEEKKHAFNSFYKKDSNNPQGTGLGLAIAKKIADVHNIKLSLSDNEPKGLVVSLVFEKEIL